MHEAGYHANGRFRGVSMRFPSWRRARGSYAVLSALSMTAILGFAAMSVDVSLMRLAQGHAQAVADAAALSALQVYHDTADQTAASDAADAVTTLNPIVGMPGQISTLTFGTWDPDAANKFDTTDPTKINAVRVSLNRNDVDLMFGKFFGALNFDVSAGATTAAQTLQVILVTDITVSWDSHDFNFVRDASVNFLDYLEANHGPNDSVGHVLFFQQFGFIWTEMTNIDAEIADPNLVHKQWEGLSTGNTAGRFMPTWRDSANFGVKHRDCVGFNTVAKNTNTGPASACPASCKKNGSQDICLTCYGNDKTNENPSCKSGHSYPLDSIRQVASFDNTYMPTLQDKFNCGIDTNGDGVANAFDCQCAGPDATGFNGIPHYFSDEGGTDHWTGLKGAEIMLQELEDTTNPNYDPVAYKAIVILTDGQPAQYGTPGAKRKASGLVEPWRSFARGSGHTVAAIQTDTQTLAAQLHDTYGVNIWFVSFVEDHAYFGNVAQGDGWYEVAASASDIADIYEKIAKSLPQTIVE
jgi:Flp pilus assembly protein TadG